MTELRYVLFGVGTLAFFATVYLAVYHPELVEGPPGEADRVAADHPLRQWDRVITWVMWGGWGMAALLTWLGKTRLLDQLPG